MVFGKRGIAVARRRAERVVNVLLRRAEFRDSRSFYMSLRKCPTIPSRFWTESPWNRMGRRGLFPWNHPRSKFQKKISVFPEVKYTPFDRPEDVGAATVHFLAYFSVLIFEERHLLGVNEELELSPPNPASLEFELKYGQLFRSFQVVQSALNDLRSAIFEFSRTTKSSCEDDCSINVGRKFQIAYERIVSEDPALGKVELHQPAARAESLRREKPLGLVGLLDLFHGKRVVLVGNSSGIAGSGLGEWVDSHDVVVRFNSFICEPFDNGRRTNIHFVYHGHHFNWDQLVDARICTGPRRAASAAYSRYLVGGRQEYIGSDETSELWSALTVRSRIDPAFDHLLAPQIEALNGIPTLGFQVIMLALGSEAGEISLHGFDGYRQAPLRLSAASHITPSSAHHPDEEIGLLENSAGWLGRRWVFTKNVGFVNFRRES